jgi:hypothetical protein
MHPHSSALLREMEITSQNERRLEQERRLMQLGDEPPTPEPGTIRLRLGTMLGSVGERWRNRAPRVRRTIEPSGS